MNISKSIIDRVSAGCGKQRGGALKIALCAMLLLLTQGIFVSASTGLDRGFGTGGKLVFNAGADAAGATSTAFAVAIHPVTGKIYVCGMGRLATTTITGVSVARFNPDGTPDATFGFSGKQLVAYQSGGMDVNARANALIVLADGSVIVAGGVSTFGVVTKLTNAGLLDAGFGTNGSFFSTFGGSSASLNAIASLADGKFVAAGSAGGNFVTAKFEPGGALDTTFGTGGFTKTAFVGSDVVAGLAIQTDGKIVAGGRASNDCAIARYNANGSPDTSFGTGGKVVTVVVTGNPDYINDVQIQPDGKIVGIGYMAPQGLERHLLLRYNANGTLDNTFGSNGVAGSYFQNNQEFVQAGRLLPNGKIVVVGYVGRNATIARYNSDGSPDRGFLCNGFGWVYFNSNLTLSYFYDVAIQADGKIVAVGQGTTQSLPQNSFAIARFDMPDTPTQCAVGDFDRDGISDISVVRPDTGGGQSIWFRQNSTGTYNAFDFAAAVPFGLSTDKYVPADYDGDGRTDIAVFRNGIWWIKRSSDSQITASQFGSAGDIPSPADYDKDGIADLCIFRPSTGVWWRQFSSNAQIDAAQFGQNGDVPMNGDFDGDGRGDIAVYRPSGSFWYVLRSSDGQAQSSQFGTAGDIPLSGDFNGDGRSDLAVFRPSTGAWYVAKPTGVPSQNFEATSFGISTDVPVPADYDGDGRTDIAVYRNGVWWILQSSSGAAKAEQFGLAADKPIPAAFLQ